MRISASFFVAFITTAHVALEASEVCQQAFDVLYATAFESHEERINAWRSKEKECAGTGLFEARLAALYQAAGEHQKAIELVNASIGFGEVYRKQLLLVRSESSYILEQLPQARADAERLVTEYPDWEGGYFVLGQVNLAEKRYEEAVENYDAVNRLGRMANAYSMLAIAHYYLKNYTKSVESMQYAVSMSQGEELGNSLPVVAASYSLIHLGYLDKALAFLQEHQAVVPESKDNLHFIRVAKFLEQKMKARAAAENESPQPAD